jgi:transcriptional regulator with XRE-family HTH domain
MSSQSEAKRQNLPANPSGLAQIEKIYFGAGSRAAQEQLQHLLGSEQSLRPYALSDTGEASAVADITSVAYASSQGYNPPTGWNAAYSLQLVQFDNQENDADEYGFHSGEEILIPVHREVQYQFFWTPGGRPPESLIMTPSGAEGSVLRINPQIPHRVRAVKGAATAWLALRHATNSPVALVMDRATGPFVLEQTAGSSQSFTADTEASSSPRNLRRRSITGGELKKAGVYALVAWGISEFIRDARQRTGRTTTELANQIGIDPSSLSRLEEAKANVSIDLLAKVCRCLRIGMAERIESGNWTHERETIEFSRSGQVDPILPKPTGTHALHPYILRLAKGEMSTISTSRGKDPNQISSWIVVKGRILLELPPEWGGKTAIIDAGNVIHFREQGILGIHPLLDSTIVQIVHSHACECKPRTRAKIT